MKTKFTAVLAAIAGWMLMVIPAKAQIYMDMNGATAGFGTLGGTAADAIWNTTNSNWNTNPSGEDGFPPDYDPPPTLGVWNNSSGTTTFTTTSGASIYVGGNFTVSGLAVTNTSGNLSLRPDNANAANTNTAITVTGGTVDVPTGGTLQLTGSGFFTTLIGSFTKTGGGTLNYSAGPAALSTFGTITSLTVQEGQMNLYRNPLLTSTTTLAITGGILNLDAGRSYNIGSLSGTSGSISWANTTSNQNLTITQTTNQTFGGVIEGQASDLRSVIKQGDATLTLTGANTYNGTMTISAGTLEVGNGGTTGSLSNTNTINNAALIFNRSDAVTYGQVISGSGTVTKSGAGVLTFGGANSYLGATTISAGTLLLSSTGSIASTTLGFHVQNTTSGVLEIQNSLYSFTGALVLTLAPVTVNNTWNLFTGSEFGPADLTISGITSDLGAFSFSDGTWNLTDGGGRDWTFDSTSGQLSVIPEPSTWALITIGLCAMTLLRRRRSKA